VKVGQRVQATVQEVDLERNRIALSMKARPELGAKPPQRTGPVDPRAARRDQPPSQNRGAGGGGGGNFNSGLFAAAFDKLGKK